MQDYLSKGEDEESARRICGKLQQDLEGRTAAIVKSPNQAVTLHNRQTDKVYLKVFLIDGSVNKNQWGVHPNSIQKNIYSAIGKPVVLYKNTGKEPDASQRIVGEYDHPYLGGSDSVQHALAYQDLYRVATYIDVFESATTPGQWWGVAEVTDEGVKRALREDPDLPMYVSPTIHLLNANEPEYAHSQWSFMHSAIVGRPAFGTDKALITGQCSGQRDTCLLQLRKAAIIANHNEIGCGFCTYKATKEIQASLRQANTRAKSVSSLEKFNENLKSDNLMTHHDNTNVKNESNNNKDQEQNQNNNNKEQNQSQEQNKDNNQEQQKQLSEQQKTDKIVEQKETKSTTVTENNNNKQASELLETVQRLAAENKNLQMQLATKDADLQTHKQINTQFETRLASLEKEREQERAAIRHEQITNYVNNAPAYRMLDAEQRAKQIETFVKGSMSIEEIQNIIEPLNASIAKNFQYPSRSASAKPRLSLGANTGKSIEVRTASEQSVQEDVPFYLQVSDMLGGSQ